MKYYLGIDIGGMTVKGILTDGSGKIYAEGSVPTDSDKGAEIMCENIARLVAELTEGVNKEEIAGAGVGCPGLIDSADGTVVFADNLNLKNFPLAKEIEKRCGFKVRLTNDANAAALGEAKFGAGSKYKNSVLITLGTGVGGGIVIDGKLFEGGKSAGTEIGHTVIVENGLKCTCGRRGCFEAYASATALINQTKRAMQKDMDSLLWKLCANDLEKVDGKTVFDAKDAGDKTAEKVVRNYIRYLAEGVTNLVNVFRPEAIVLGGGVCAQGEKLIRPLKRKVNSLAYGGVKYAPVQIVTASLGNDAGLCGAARLAMLR